VIRVELSPATADDLEQLRKFPVARMRGLAARLDGQTIGIGGFMYFADGSVWATMLVTPRGREFPVAVFRAGVLAMRLARRLGLREIFASPDESEPAAERFLERLGFIRVGEFGDEILFRWRV
jgi:RimJ/RimL family protein N-acetyltransferase